MKATPKRKLGKIFRGYVFALAIFLLAFIFVPYVVAEAKANATTNVSASVDWGATYLTFAPSDITFSSITPTAVSGSNYGTMQVAKDTLTVHTSGKYYTIYISMADSSQDLLLGGTSSSITIPAIGDGFTTGVWGNPTAFSRAGWGFAVPGTSISTTYNSSIVTPMFSQASYYTSDYLNTDLTYASEPSVYNQATWVAVPASGSAQQIWKATTNNANGFGTWSNGTESYTGDTDNNHFDVYYAVMVDESILSGTYENDIVYTALASSTSLDSASNNLNVSDYYVTSGATETITFDLASSVSGLISSDDIEVYLVPHSTFCTTTSGTTTCDYSVTSAMETAADADTYSECTITGAMFGNNSTTITCAMPSSDIADGTGAGEYDFWVRLPDYNYNYVSKYTYGSSNYIATAVYAGLQSTYANTTAGATYTDPRYSSTSGANNHFIQEMQSVTATACTNTNQWGSMTAYVASSDDANNAGTLNASNVALYDYTGSGTAISSGVDLTGSADGIGTFELTDNRDSNTKGY